MVWIVIAEQSVPSNRTTSMFIARQRRIYARPWRIVLGMFLRARRQREDDIY
jgi:hypothetical protein